MDEAKVGIPQKTFLDLSSEVILEPRKCMIIVMQSLGNIVDYTIQIFKLLRGTVSAVHVHDPTAIIQDTLRANSPKCVGTPAGSFPDGRVPKRNSSI